MRNVEQDIYLHNKRPDNSMLFLHNTRIFIHYFLFVGITIVKVILMHSALRGNDLYKVMVMTGNGMDMVMTKCPLLTTMYQERSLLGT
jgi:hypothetical protein